MSRLEDVIPKAEGETIAPKKTFKNYEPGFIHIDIKCLPPMPDETEAVQPPHYMAPTGRENA